MSSKLCYFIFSFFFNKALCLIYCSNAGLTETDLRCLLASSYQFNTDNNLYPQQQQKQINKELPMMVWLKLHLKLKPFLMNTSTGGEEMFYFFHTSIEQVSSKISAAVSKSLSKNLNF